MLFFFPHCSLDTITQFGVFFYNEMAQNLMDFAPAPFDYTKKNRQTVDDDSLFIIQVTRWNILTLNYIPCSNIFKII